MAHGFTVQGGLGAGGSIIPHESSAHSVLVPDTELLFTAQFHRAGPDLVLTGRDGAHHLIPNYFSSEHHPSLVAPNGAHLSPDTVDLLAGSPTPGHYAQAQSTAPADSIGKIEKVVGDVTVVRNGVAVALHVGDAVFKSDVVQTGASSSCGISFPDGTALNLVANTRMALNDYAFDASSNSNGALFTLVEGTFAFVAGKVAHQGDMKIATPVATMGIRGTTGVVQEQPSAPATITANAGDHTYSFAVVPDIGTGITGVWDCYLTDAQGIIQRDANGNPIVLATISQNGYVTYLTPQGLGQPPLVTTEPATNSQYAFEQQMLSDLFRTLNPANLNNNNSGGSSTPPPPFELPNPIPQLFEDSGKPFTINGSGSGPTITVTVNDTVGSSGPLTVVIWIAGGNGPWSAGPSWLGGAPPTSPQEVEILNPVKVTTDGSDSAAGLVINAGAILNIVSGTSFTIYDFIHGAGTIAINSSGSDPTLFIHGGVTLVGGGTIKMLGPAGEDNILGVPGTSATLVNIDYTIEGTGTIGGGDGNLTFQNFGIVNANNGVLTVNTGNQVYNDGLMEATVDPVAATTGTLAIKDSVANAGTVQADGIGAAVTLSGTTFDNLFSVVAKNGGSVTFTNVKVTNEAISTTDPTGGTINANGGTIAFDGGSIANNNLLEATNVGTLQLENITVTNSSAATASVDGTSTLDLMGAAILGGTIENAGNVVVTDGASVLHGDSVTNTGTMTVETGGSLTLEGDATLLNDTGGKIIADGGTVTIEMDVDANVNSGTIKAVNGGEVDFHVNIDGGSNYGLIEAGAGGTVHFFGGGGGGGGSSSSGSSGDKGGNYGTMEATDGGILIFDGGLDNFYLVEALNGGLVYLNNGIKNHAGTVESSGSGSQISISNSGESENADTIIAESDGVIALASVVLTNDAHAMIEATSGGSISWITGGIDNFGTFDADGGTITFGGSIGITNEATGIFEASNGGTITFGTSGIGSVTNAAGGLIEALSGGTITFDSTLNGAQNAGTIKADGGTIVIDGFEGGNGLFNGDGMGGIGIVEAIHGGKVELAGATIIGGKLGTMSGGEFETVTGTSSNTSTLLNVILTGGVFTIDPNAILDLNGGTNGVAAYIDSTVTLEGPGTVEMDFTSYSIRGGASNGTLDNQTTIEGRGTIGNGDSPAPGLLTLINSGTIEAVGGEFIINTGTRLGATTTTNSGTLEANGANAVLLIHHTNIDNTNGTIAAINDLNAAPATASVVELLDVNIVGGTLRTSFGTIETITDNGAPTTSSFDGVTNLGYVYVGDNTTLILRHTINQSSPSDIATGKIALGFGGNATLEIDGTVALNGGQVEMNGGGDKIGALGPNSTLDNASTIYGAGQIGDGNSDTYLTLDNQAGGDVNANINGATLTIHTGNTVTNAGTLESSNGGTLDVKDSVDNTSAINAGFGSFIVFESASSIINDGGTIKADAGSINIKLSITSLTNENGGIIEAVDGGVVQIEARTVHNSGGTIEAIGTNSTMEIGGSDIIGGTLKTSNDGLIDVLAGITTFDGLTIATGSDVKVDAGVVVVLADTIENDGNIEVVNSNAGLEVQGTVTLTGTGTVTLDGSTATIKGEGIGTFTLDNASTIQGAGTIGGQGLVLDNQSGGIVNANIDSATLTIHTGNTVTNGGTLEATNGGTLQIDDAVTNSNAVDAHDSGSTVVLAGGGSNSGTITATGGGAITIDNANNTGGYNSNLIQAGAGGTITINNTNDSGVWNSGTIEALTGGTLNIYDLNDTNIKNTGTIDADGGTINITHDHSSVINQNLVEAIDGGTINITNINNSNVSGGGNAGTQKADGGTINVNGGSANLGTGTMEAINGGTFDIISGGLSNASGGTVKAASGGTFDINGGLNNASGAVIEALAGGTINISNTSGYGNSGTIKADGGEVSLTLTGDGGVNNNAGGATIEAIHGGTLGITINHAGNNSSGGVGNSGTIEADCGTLTIALDITGNCNSVGIDNTGMIEAIHGGTININIDNTGTHNATGMSNSATEEALSGGTLNINSGVGNSGTITADDGTVAITTYLDNSNGGTVEAQDQGTVTISCAQVTTETDSLIGASGAGSTVTIDHSHIENAGGIGAESGGSVTIEYSTVDNNGAGTGNTNGIGAETGGTITFEHSDVVNCGDIGADNGGAVKFEHSHVDNYGHIGPGPESGQPPGAVATVTFAYSHVNNSGEIGASTAGVICIDCSTICNTGELDAVNGGVINIDHSTIDNACGIIEASGCGSTINLDQVTITGGTLETSCDGLIQIVCGTSTFDGVAVKAGSDVEVTSGATLTLHDTTDLGGTLTVDSGATVAIDSTDPGNVSTLDDVKVTNNGTIQIDDLTSSATLILDDDTTISGGIVSIGSVGMLEIGTGDSGSGATLDNVTVHDSGAILVHSGATLTLDDGTTISGGGVGMLTVASGSTLAIESGGATLACLTVDNCGGDITVAADTTLSLNRVIVHGGAIDGIDAVTSGDIVVASTIDVTGDSTFCNVDLSHGDVTIESNVTLTLTGGSISDVAITGTDASGCVVASTIDVTGDSTFCHVNLSGGNLTVESAHTLTLDNSTLDDVTVTLVYDNKALVGADLQVNGTLTLDDATITGQSGIIHDGGTIDVIGSSEIDDVSVSLGRIHVESNQTLTLDNAVLDGDTVTLVSTVVHENVVGANLQVEDTLFLVNATIDGTGTIHNCGTIDVQGSGSQSEIDGVTIANHDGSLQIDGGATLVLNDVAVHGGSIDGTDASGCVVASTIDVTGDSTFCDVDLSGGNLTVEGDVTLKLSGVTVDGTNIDDYTDSGSFVIPGAIEITGNSAINNSTVDGEGGPAGGASPGAITVDCNVTLTLDNTTLEDLHVTNHGALQVDGDDTLTLNTVQIDGGTINNFTDSGGIVAGNIDVTGDTTFGDLTVEKGNLTINDHTALDVADGTTVTLDGVNVTDNGDLGDVNPGSGATLVLEGGTTITGSETGGLTISSGDSLQIEQGCGPDQGATFDALTVENAGTIQIDATLTIADAVSFNDGGTVSMATSGQIVGDSSPATLENVDNTIAGAGMIGGGCLTLSNDTHGTIDANVGAATLTLDTGANTISNAGLFEASNGATLDIKSHIDNTGGSLLAASGGLVDVEKDICGGTATIDHGTLEFGAKSDVDVTFHNSNGYGELILGDPADFSGKIFCFTGTDAGLSNSDEVFLTGVTKTDFSTSYDSAHNLTTLTVDEASGGPIVLHFSGDYTGKFEFVQGAGGLEIYDPPVGGAKQAASTVTTASNGHTSAPANEIAHVTDHATSLSNLFGFGGDQDTTQGATSHGGGLANGSFVNGVAEGGAGEAGAGATNDGSTQSLLSSLLKTLTGGTDGTAPSIDLGSGHGQAAIAPALVTTAPGNEHAVAPSQIASPTVASTSFGAMGNDSFAFHANLGSNGPQNNLSHVNELAHDNNQIAAPPPAAATPDVHQEFAFDVVHQDIVALTTTVDQFHQMAASSTLLH